MPLSSFMAHPVHLRMWEPASFPGCLATITRDLDGEIHVLVATSGDTGSAVANGFLGVPGIKVHVLYPSGLVTPLQEKQFTTLGENISAVEVRGNL